MSINNPTHPARRRLGTQEQAARIWGCDVRTIRNRISDGTLTGFKLPGTRAIRVDLNEVERLLEVIPAAKRQPHKPFGPDARIVNVIEPVRAEVVTDEP